MLFSIVSTAAMAQMKSGYGEAGCGLGSMLFGNQKGPVQIVAATVNGTFGSQTFGMTSGTSNCSQVLGKSTISFIEANKQSLLNDMAKGEGETINSLSAMMGCKDAKAFGSNLQKNYKNILNTQNTTAAEMNKAIMNVAKDANLNCTPSHTL